jgi:hypothetical protein
MRTILLALSLFVLLLEAKMPDLVRFKEHVVASGLNGGYQVVVVDMNKDGRPDLIALSERDASDLVWFEHPGDATGAWPRHVIVSNLRRMINVAAADLDGDGIPELLLASEFFPQKSAEGGQISLLRHKGDPRQPWQLSPIDRLPTSHRLRWARLDGKERVLINAPLLGAGSKAPDYKVDTPLVFYHPPAHLDGAWKRELLDDKLRGVSHGLFVYDFDGDGKDEVFTASFDGIFMHKLGQPRTKIADGHRGEWPKIGSSDVCIGKLKDRYFFAAIEPWHGNELALYTRAKDQWSRQVIATDLQDGHALVCADLNGDGYDEIIAGSRGASRSVYAYYANNDRGLAWTRQVLDNGGIAAANCVAADLNGDGRLDIVCIGSATGNLKWYENLGTK